jgi:hypothetical protein
MGKNPDLGSKMNISDHFYDNLETIFGLKILKFFDVNLGSGIFWTEDPGSGMENFGSMICDPQH